MRELLQALITNRTELARNIVLFELQGIESPLPPFSAGAHIDIRVPGYAETWRSYSLTNDPIEKNRYEIVLLRNEQREDSATNALCDYAAIGARVTLNPPHNTFPLDESASHYLFIAGGIGITPLRSMMLVLRRLHKPFSLIYTAHSVEETAFFGEISSWSENIKFHFSKGPPHQRIDILPLIGPFVEGKKIYCCAPEGLMQTVRAAASKLQWPFEAICFERFSVPPISSSVQRYVCEVVAAISKKTTFSQQGETLLVTLRRMGIEVPSSCEAGTCGTCLVDVREGTVEPHDLFLTPAEHKEGKLAISCVGIPIGPKIVVEL